MQKTSKIDWSLLLSFWWVALISSYLWTNLHMYYPADLDRGVSGWMFYDKMLLIPKLLFGGTIEDMALFHPFGLLFGGLLALNVFKIFEPIEKDCTNQRIFLFGVPLIFFTVMSLIIDGSSRISFFIFLLPTLATIKFSWKYINPTRFFLFFMSMIIFTFIWDFTSVYAPSKIWDDYARCWFYIKDGVHSLLYSTNLKHWILGEMPVSIDIIYPACGMLFLTSFIGFIKWLRNDKL